MKNLLTEKEKNAYLRKLGKRIRELREKKGYSNYEFFAYDFGISRTQYGKYEAGGNIQFDTLLNILKIHGITLKDFFSKGFD